MVKAVYLHVLTTVRLIGISVYLILSLLELACTPTQQATLHEEPSLKPLPGTGGSVDPEQIGRQAASFQLTEEGREHLRAGRLEEAMSKLQKAISLSASNAYAYYYFGEVRYQKQEYHQSLPLLERAELFFRSDPVWLSRVYVLRGKNYEALSRYEEAKAEYQRALAQDPHNPEAQAGVERLDTLSEFN